jgi:carbamoylphosphate synthase large subunit
MCNKEIEKADKQIKAFGKKISSNKKLSEEFLRSIGILTPDGMVSEHYKELYIQHAQD